METAFFSKYLTFQKSTYLYTYKKGSVAEGSEHQTWNSEVMGSSPIMTLGAVFSVVPGHLPAMLPNSQDLLVCLLPVDI